MNQFLAGFVRFQLAFEAWRHYLLISTDQKDLLVDKDLILSDIRKVFFNGLNGFRVQTQVR